MIPRIAVCPPVIQEVLQGIKNDDVLTRIRRSLLSFNLAGKNLTVDHYAEVSSIYVLQDVEELLFDHRSIV
jgi:hypothetical protein